MKASGKEQIENVVNNENNMHCTHCFNGRLVANTAAVA